MSTNSEYRCPDCRQPVKQFVGKNHARIGVIHSPTCKLFAKIASLYPALVERIEKERSAA